MAEMDENEAVAKSKTTQGFFALRDSKSKSSLSMNSKNAHILRPEAASLSQMGERMQTELVGAGLKHGPSDVYMNQSVPFPVATQA